MNEDFLKYVWKYRRYASLPIATSCGKSLEIIHPGIENFDAGPDFSNARIRIEDTIWAGNIEIHVKSSDWFKHFHHQNKAYNNIILHVVYQHDADVFRQSGELIPTLALQACIIPQMLDKFRQLQQSNYWIPCQNHLKELNGDTLPFWFERLAIQRLERKSDDIESLVTYYNGDWEQAFFVMLGRAFGFGVNSQAFEMLNKSLSFTTLLRHRDNISHLEAFLFGQSGLLELQPFDPYVKYLQREYEHLSAKYQLKPMAHQQWKLLRLRPVNFPTLRMSQLAVLIHEKGRLFDAVLQCGSAHELFEIFEAKTTPYWETHYVFGKTTGKKSKTLGKDAALSVLINAAVPFLFVYGKIRNLPEIQERAVDFLNQLPAEKNAIVNRYEQLGCKATNALRSQSLLQLKSHYCDHKKCLSCHIGNLILSPSA